MKAKFTPATLFFNVLIILKALKFNQDGEFVILQLSDMHYANCDGPLNNVENIEIQQTMLDLVQPDLVVVTGDIVSNYCWQGEEEFYQENWELFSQIFTHYEQFYAMVPGNHDYGNNINISQIFTLDQTNNYSMARNSTTGSFTYWHPIQSQLLEGRDAAIIWLFDSHSSGCENNTASYGCINSTQVEWYNEESALIKARQGNTTGLAFFHIPIVQYLDIYNNEEFFGTSGEPLSCSSVDTGFFESAQNEGTISAMFVGHDHDNDFGGYLNGIELVYTRKTGFGCYGPRNRVRGGRVITLKESLDTNGILNVEYDHYIMQADGVKVYPNDWKIRTAGEQGECLTGTAPIIDELEEYGTPLVVGIVLGGLICYLNKRNPKRGFTRLQQFQVMWFIFSFVQLFSQMCEGKKNERFLHLIYQQFNSFDILFNLFTLPKLSLLALLFMKGSSIFNIFSAI